MILYADVLFMIDFSMDVISLYITGRLTHSRMNPRRVSLAAVIGAVCSVLVTLFSLKRIISLLLCGAVSGIMCYVSFCKSDLFTYLRRYIILWTSGMLLGGIMTTLMTAGNNANNTNHNAVGTNIVPLIPLACGIILLLTATLSKVSSKKQIPITIKLRGKSVELTGLTDSGNLLEDPFTGEAVIVVFFEKVRNLFEEHEQNFLMCNDSQNIPYDLSERLRLIPAQGISGETLLKAIKADEIIVGTKSCRAIMAINASENHSHDFDCIVPSKLL